MPSDTLTLRTLMVENNRLKEQLKDMQDEISQLRQIIRALNRLQYSLDTITVDTDVVALIHNILSAALETVNSQDGSLQLYDSEKDELVFVEVLGPARERLMGQRTPASEGIAGWTLRERAPALVAEAAYDSRWSARVDELSGYETGSVISVPLLDGEQPLG